MSTLKVDGIRSNSASSDAITLASDGTCTANITNNLSNRNLITNGAMQVAQYGTSSTTNGYGSVDRFPIYNQSTDEAPTHAQVDVASGTTPYTLGFRKALKITNGNQTSGAGSGDLIAISYPVEAQDLATSGWNYLSSSSNITLSFWVKSSVAQNFYVMIRTEDGTQYNYPIETGSLTADTWTKVTKTIPGNSNLTINNDSGRGMLMEFVLFRGTDGTGSVTLNEWAAYSSSARVPNMTSTWYTTNDATFEMTGVQLEVGSVATDFEHRSYGQELALCQRYYYRHATGADTSSDYSIATFATYQANDIFGMVDLPVTMRANPSIDQVTGSSYYKVYRDGGSDAFDSFGGVWSASPTCVGLNANSGTGVSGCTAGHATFVKTNATNAYLAFSAEL